MGRIARCCFDAVVLALTLASAALGGCAESQTTLLARQQTVADAPAPGRRLFYIGLGLYSEPWSENDVVELADKLQYASQYRVMPMIASDVTSTNTRSSGPAFVAAVPINAATVSSSAIGYCRANDISSHGARQMRARRVGNSAPTALSSRATLYDAPVF